MGAVFAAVNIPAVCCQNRRSVRAGLTGSSGCGVAQILKPAEKKQKFVYAGGMASPSARPSKEARVLKQGVA